MAHSLGTTILVGDKYLEVGKGTKKTATVI